MVRLPSILMVRVNVGSPGFVPMAGAGGWGLDLLQNLTIRQPAQICVVLLLWSAGLRSINHSHD
jgi:hypothetical protein